ARDDVTQACGEASIAKHDLESMRLDRDKAAAKLERVHREMEQAHRETEDERKRRVEGEEVIRAANFIRWVDEWQETQEGQEWLSDSYRGARM
ncbi:hypothetical protein Dimus_016122, partial [Dionaea muscipula]